MKAQNRKEIFLKALANGEEPSIKPLTREELLLKKQAERESVSGGGGTPHWDDIEGKPFEVVGSDTLTWDGNTEGKLTIQSPGAPFSFVKISDATPTLEDFANGGEIDVFLISENAISETKPLDETTIVENETGIVINNMSIIVVTEPHDVFTEKGIWARIDAVTFCSRIKINGYTGFNPQEKIKEEYLPSGGGAFVVNVSIDDETGDYIADKTYGDIRNAIKNGCVVLLYEIDEGNGSIMVYFASYSDNDSIHFSKINDAETYYELNADNTVVQYSGR